MFEVTKIKKKAEIFFSDGTTMTGNFFVAPHAPTHAGTESVADLLSNDRLYIPFETIDGHVVLVQKNCIVKILLAESNIDKNLPYLEDAQAQVVFLSGETLEGKVYLDLPKSNSRLSDFLNYSRQFFYLEVGTRDYLVNSGLVQYVQPGMNRHTSLHSRTIGSLQD